MKSSHTRPALAIVFLLLPLSLFAQGPIAPTGTPGPTMKTLDQIEARTPIAGSTTPVFITSPGTYYLTGNITVSSSHGININVNNVTLDLNGFTISSTASPASGDGIHFNGVISNVAICNGMISGGVTEQFGNYTGNGFSRGINRASTNATGISVRNVIVTGVLIDGINVGNSNGSVVEFCTVRTTSGSGIIADTVSNCTVTDCYNDGIVALNVENSACDCYFSAITAKTVNGCYANSKNSLAISASVATNCYATGVNGIAVSSATNCTATGTTLDAIDAIVATNCTGTSTSADGLNSTIATGCAGTSTSGNGLYATQSATNCYGTTSTGPANTVTYGLYTQVANNCTGVYSGTANNCFGLYASALAIGSYGFCSTGTSTSTGLFAFIANTCHGINQGGAAVSISTSHNINSF